MAVLYLMCGVPGSGKSTFLKNKIKHNENTAIISRDEIRFSLLKPNDSYFSHEDEVLKIFFNQINKSLAAGFDTFVDQTSLTPTARRKLLNNVRGYDYAVAIWVDESLETCLDRNEMRKGTRAYVPEVTVRNMYSQFRRPHLNEGFKIIYHYNSKDDVITYEGNLT